MSSDRPRWLNPEAAGDRRLAELIDAGRSEQPSAAAQQALAERLAETFRGPGPGGGGGGDGGGGTAAAIALPFARLAAAAVIIAAVGSIAWWLGRDRDAGQDAPRSASLVRAADEQTERRAVPAPALPAEPAVEAATAVPAADAGVPERSASAHAHDAGARVRRTQRPPRTATETSPEPARADPGSELRLLDAAERELASAPGRALALTEQHAQRYPAGQLIQERELLAIEALVRLHDGARAQARGRAFLARYAGSSHAPRVRALLLEAGTPNPRR